MPNTPLGRRTPYGLDRLCVFVPPVHDEDIAERMHVLEGQPSFSDLWGYEDDDVEWRSRVVALRSFRGERAVLVSSKRTASAYRAVGMDLQRGVAREPT